MVNSKIPEKSNKNNSNERRASPSYSESYKMRNKGLTSGNSSSFGNAIKNDIKKAEAGIKSEFKALNSGRDKAIYNEHMVSSRRARKIEKILIGVIYVIVILIGIYFLLVTFYPDIVPGANTYEIKASDHSIFNSLSSFYIEDPSVLGDAKEVNGEIVRPIISSKKFNFIFKPKENIPAGKSATFYLDLVLNESNPGNIYVDEQLVFPSLEGYKLVKETSTDYIYVKDDVLNYVNDNSFVDAPTTEEFIYKNLPSASVWSTRKLNPVELNVPDYKKENTLINGTFRGDLTLAVYCEGDLKIDFVKQDLNMYLGEDTAVVNITDSSGNVIYTNKISDDLDKFASNKVGKEQKFTIRLDNLKRGVYYMKFKDTSEGSDIVVKNIKLNSNKVLIVGTFLPWREFRFYTKSSIVKGVGFMYWWVGKEQIIRVSGAKKKIIDLTSNLLNQRYEENFTHGDYYFDISKGYLLVYNDISSSSSENWFDLYFSPQETFNNPSLVVVDKSSYSKDRLILQKDLGSIKTNTRISIRTLTSNSANFELAGIKIRE